MAVMTKTPNALEDTELNATLKPDQWLGIRHLQIVLMFIGMFTAYTLRVNLSVAIVAMVDSENANPDFPEYNWDESTKGIILSSFFWGYVVGLIPAGQLALIVGPKPLLVVSLGVASIFSILTPSAAVWGDWGLVCAFRVIQGLAQGLLFPSMHTLLARWTPNEERGTLVTFVYSGAQLGTVFALPLCGFLATSSAGWPSCFYVFGGLGLVWAVLWLWLGANSPAEDRFISAEERAYIEDSLRTSDKPSAPLSTPWKAMLTSLPVWAIVVANCGHGWGFWTLLTEMPSFMNSVLHFDLKSNGLLSAVPYLAMFLLSFVFSFASDYIHNHRVMSKTASRKLFNSIGLLVPAATLIGLSYATDPTLAIVLLTVAVGVNSAIYVGFNLNHIDLAPNYAGTMMGIANGLANVMSIIGPLVVGAVVTDSGSVSQWRIVFFIASGIYIFTGSFYALFAIADLQWWNEPSSRDVTLSTITSNTLNNNVDFKDKEDVVNHKDKEDVVTPADDKLSDDIM